MGMFNVEPVRLPPAFGDRIQLPIEQKAQRDDEYGRLVDWLRTDEVLRLTGADDGWTATSDA